MVVPTRVCDALGRRLPRRKRFLETLTLETTGRVVSAPGPLPPPGVGPATLIVTVAAGAGEVPSVAE